MNLDSVEGNHFEAGIPKVKAKLIEIKGADIADYVRNASAIMDETGIFPVDSFKEEPEWPKNLASIMMGCAMAIAERLDRSNALAEERNMLSSEGNCVAAEAVMLSKKLAEKSMGIVVDGESNPEVSRGLN